MPVKPNQSYSTRVTGDVLMTVRADTAASEASAANKYSPLMTDASGRLWTVGASSGGAVADGEAVTSTNPDIIGVEARNTQKYAVNDGDAVRLQGDIQGRLVVTGSQRELSQVNQTTITGPTVTATIIPASGTAGVFTDLVTLVVTNSSATAANVTIDDGSADVLIIHAKAESNDVINFGLVPLKQSASNTAWTATTDTAVASLQITAVVALRSTVVAP